MFELFIFFYNPLLVIIQIGMLVSQFDINFLVIGDV